MQRFADPEQLASAIERAGYLPDAGIAAAAFLAMRMHRRRLRQADLLKPPGVAESLDWAQALHLLGARSLDREHAAATLGTVLKYHEDAERIRDTVLAELIA